MVLEIEFFVGTDHSIELKCVMMTIKKQQQDKWADYDPCPVRLN